MVKIEIKNPKFVMIGNSAIVRHPISDEQILRQIEKLLLTKSIIADEVKIIK